MQITKLNWLIYFIIISFSYGLSSTITYAESDSPNIFYIDKLKSESSESSKTKLERRAAPSFKKPLASIQDGLIASYDLTQNANDSTGITGSMLLSNTHFNDNSLYLNGLYHIDENTGYYASTPFLNINTFDPTTTTNHFDLTFSLKFFPIAFGKNNDITYPKYRNTIIMGGRSYRWLSIRKGHDTNSLEVMFNNSKETYTFDNLSLDEKKWHTLSFSFSLQQKTFLLALNGTLIGEKRLPSDFDLEFLGLGSSVVESESTLLFTDYANGGIFYGNIKDLIIFNKFHHASELISLNSDTSDTTTKTVSYTDTFNLKIDQPLAVDASVDYQTRDGTAKAGTDYIATSGTATIPAGQTSVDIGVDILIANTDKTFSLVITNPKGAEFPAGTSEIAVSHTIKDAGSTVISAPTASKIVEASSLDSDKIIVSWMAAEDKNTAQADLRYTVHVAESENFQPSSSTQNTQVKGQLSAIATGLKANTQYYVRVVATNQKNEESWSDILAVKTVATAIKRTSQNVVVQDAQTPIISDNSVTFADQGSTPQVGDVISNTTENSYLRTVKKVSTQNGQTTVETEPATLTDVFTDIDIATTIKVRPVENQTQRLARKQHSAMKMKVVGSQRHINWQKSGLTLISEVAAPLVQQKQSTRPLAKTEVINDKQIKTGSHAQLQAPAFLSVKPNETLSFTLEAKTTQSSNNWEICKISLVDIEHDDSNLETLASPQIGTTVITDAEQKGTLNAIWTPSAQHIDSKGRPYHFIFTAFIDDRGENCNGDQFTRLWDETITVDIPVYVSFGEDDSQADIENKKLTFTGDFSIDNEVTFEFIPELSIAASIKHSTLQSASITASTDITVANELTIKASGAGNLNDEKVLIPARKFIKVFVTPAGIPIVVGGEFSLKANIDANVTGAMQINERLELAFPNTSFGMEYNASRTQKWQAVKNFEPTYQFSLSGDANASANVKVTLIPDFQIHFYDAAAGRMLVEPYAYADADLHGQFRYLDDAGAESYDLDYWFNTLEAGAGVDLKLYAGLEIFGINIISYPSYAKRDDPNTFAQFSPIAKTPLWALPKLSAAMDTTKSLPTDSRSILITGTAENMPFPFGNKKSLNTFTNWVTPKVLFADSQTQAPATSASLVENSNQAGSYWFKYTKAGRYLARLGGYSEGGSWLRQKIDLEINIEDIDNNGIPDLWEQRYGISDPNADPDQDGLSNLEEFQQGRFPKQADNPNPDPITPPQNLQASAGNQQITFTWDALANADSYTLYLAEEPDFTPDNYAAHNGGQMFPAVSSPYTVTGLSTGKTYYAIVTATLNGVESAASSPISVTLPNPSALDEIALVSVSSTGEQGNGYSHNPRISADGRYITFMSSATNLVDNDTNDERDIFVHDRQTSQTTRVSVSSTGEQGNGHSHNPSISANGRFIAFDSVANNLVDNDTNGISDVFVHDRQTGETTRVSVSSTGVQGNNGSYNPSISADGRYITFWSSAMNLVDNDTNGRDDIFVHDRQTGETTRVSVSRTGKQGNSNSYHPSISADGRYITFVSYATNLVNNDTNGSIDVFVHDRITGQTTLVSVSRTGEQGNRYSSYSHISADGRYITFESDATNLVDNDTNGEADIFVHDRQTGETASVSVSHAAEQGNNRSYDPHISADGRYITFYSFATNLVDNDTNYTGDVFVAPNPLYTTD